MKKEKSSVKSAGVHILLDFWGAKNINSVKFVRKALFDAVKASKFTLLKVDLHKFSPQGVSGVAIIAESHISIHTWPEYEFAAIDIFSCGDKDPKPAVKSLKKSFTPKKVLTKEIQRGEFKHL
jgi:S-adenosylmethionine decarboxylase